MKHDNDYEVGALEKTIDNLTTENEELERLYKELQDDMLACNKCRATIKLQQQLDQLETENEELKKQLQTQRAFTRHEQKLIYCVAYDETCKTGKDCKQEKCIFKDNIKLKQTLTEIKGIVKPHQRNIDKICGHCRRYDCCHACCIDDINCYQYKKPTTPACDKYCELKEFDINNMANQVLQKINEVEDA